jgi:AbrB family looped-hinge helix DNA binding protein
MAKKKGLSNDLVSCMSMGCCNCKIDAMLSVDERGQMVLPKDLRDKAGIKAGDKLAAISWEQEGKTACIVLIKSDNLAEMVKGFLGPVFKDLFQK